MAICGLYTDPFDHRCNREDDYAIVWEEFERRNNNV